MNVSGFKMANRLDGLDLDHVKLVMTKLAKFHAASALFYEKVKRFLIIFFSTKY